MTYCLLGSPTVSKYSSYSKTIHDTEWNFDSMCQNVSAMVKFLTHKRVSEKLCWEFLNLGFSPKISHIAFQAYNFFLPDSSPFKEQLKDCGQGGTISSSFTWAPPAQNTFCHFAQHNPWASSPHQSLLVCCFQDVFSCLSSPIPLTSLPLGIEPSHFQVVSRQLHPPLSPAWRATQVKPQTNPEKQMLVVLCHELCSARYTLAHLSHENGCH